VAGLLLAAGSGRRMGRPKALVRDAAGTPWVVRTLQALRDGGCDTLTVVVGAAADEVRAALAGVPGTGAAEPRRRDVQVVEAAGWAEGMGASLRAGLDALASVHPPADAAVVMLVDLPEVGAEVVHRVLFEAATGVGDPTRVLCRAAYRGVPGHPVLIGSAHWADVIATAAEDSGARGYLAGRDVRLVECGDLASGRDVDTRAERD